MKLHLSHQIVCVALLAFGLVVGGSVSAQPHEHARGLRESGRIVPLSDITAKARRRYGGRVLEAELEENGDRYVYEVEVLDKSGEVHRLRYDARTGRQLSR